MTTVTDWLMALLGLGVLAAALHGEVHDLTQRTWIPAAAALRQVVEATR